MNVAKGRPVQTIGVGLLALGIVAGIALSVALIEANARLKRVGVAGGLPSILGTIRDPRSRFPAGTHRLNVLLIGKDYNRDRKGMPFTKGSRSDTLVVLSLDLDHRAVSALSVPRDTYVQAPDGHRGKINGAYARGGAPLAMRTVGALLGVEPDHYVALKDNAVKTIVDSLGGVEVESLDQMRYDDHWGQLHIDLPAGRQTLTGEQAIGFVRFRKVNAGQPHSKEEGDARRMARQQQLIRSLVQKARQRFLDPRHWPEADAFLLAALSAVDTDLTQEQLFALVALYRDVAPERIQTDTLAARDFKSGGLWYVRPEPATAQAQVDWLLRGDESAARKLTRVAVVTTAPDGDPACRHVADLLRRAGFGAAVKEARARPFATSLGSRAGTPIRDVDTDAGQTHVAYSRAAVLPRAEVVANLVKGGPPVKQSDLPGGADVVVLLGRDERETTSSPAHL
jgi:LCP family protein required for cell wall assembly